MIIFKHEKAPKKGVFRTSSVSSGGVPAIKAIKITHKLKTCFQSWQICSEYTSPHARKGSAKTTFLYVLCVRTSLAAARTRKPLSALVLRKNGPFF
jgi:hypothetical protein